MTEFRSTATRDPFVVTPDGKTMYVAEEVTFTGLTSSMFRGEKASPGDSAARVVHALHNRNSEHAHARIALTPDLKQLWATDVIDGGMYVYDISTKKMSAKISVGKCWWISISSDGKYVAVSNAESDSVSIVDGKTHKVLAEVPVGKGPKRLEIVDVPEQQVTN